MGKKRAVEDVPVKIEEGQKKLCFTRAFQFEESSIPTHDDAGAATRPAVATASLASLVVSGSLDGTATTSLVAGSLVASPSVAASNGAVGVGAVASGVVGAGVRVKLEPGTMPVPVLGARSFIDLDSSSSDDEDTSAGVVNAPVVTQSENLGTMADPKQQVVTASSPPSDDGVIEFRDAKHRQDKFQYNIARVPPDVLKRWDELKVARRNDNTRQAFVTAVASVVDGKWSKPCTETYHYGLGDQGSRRRWEMGDVREGGTGTRQISG